MEQCEVCKEYSDRILYDLIKYLPNPWKISEQNCSLLINRNYMVSVDYCSSFWKMDYLQETQVRIMIRKLNAYFARSDKPDMLCKVHCCRIQMIQHHMEI